MIKQIINEDGVVDWRMAIDNISKLNNDDIRRLTGLTTTWTTCACGNLCKNIPRFITGEPHDIKLAMLGDTFNHIFEDFASGLNNMTLPDEQRFQEKMRVCLDLIEARANELLG